ncbi:MAG: N-acetyltransferase [Phycisphaeraceae bacterium]
MTVAIEQAGVADVPGMAALINDYAEQGLMLHRSHAELYERVRDFEVARLEGEVVGVVGLRIMWSNLAEVYALAVSPRATGQGLGRKLVAAAVDEARRLGIHRTFSLTYEQRFFDRCGFKVVDRHRELPLKVWSECARCPKNHACDEIAMVHVLEDVPDLGPPPQASPQMSLYEVPMLNERMKRLDSSAD